MSETRELFFYRGEGAHRQRYRFVVDNRGTILEETAVSDGRQATPVLSAREQTLKERKIEFHRDASGALVITKVPTREQDIQRFFQETYDCNFPGCEELHASFLQDLAKMGTDCRGCDKATVINRYREQLEAHFPP